MLVLSQQFSTHLSLVSLGNIQKHRIRHGSTIQLVRYFDENCFYKILACGIDGSLKILCFTLIVTFQLDILQFLYKICQTNYCFCFLGFFFCRKILFTVGEETGQEELKKLKALLSFNSKVGKRTLDQIQDVWGCLDVLEERFLDSELVSFLRIMYAANARLLKIIDDFEGLFIFVFVFFNDQKLQR